MRLNKLSPGKGAKKEGKRLGRGHSAGQGKTSRSWSEGPARALGRLPQGRLRRRSDAAAAAPAKGWFQLAHGEVSRRSCGLHELAIPTADVIDIDVLKS